MDHQLLVLISFCKKPFLAVIVFLRDKWQLFFVLNYKHTKNHKLKAVV